MLLIYLIKNQILNVPASSSRLSDTLDNLLALALTCMLAIGDICCRLVNLHHLAGNFFYGGIISSAAAANWLELPEACSTPEAICSGIAESSVEPLPTYLPPELPS